MSKPPRCPTCQGPIERRTTTTYEAILACLGACGTLWSVFDYMLAAKP